MVRGCDSVVLHAGLPSPSRGPNAAIARHSAMHESPSPAKNTAASEECAMALSTHAQRQYGCEMWVQATEVIRISLQLVAPRRAGERASGVRVKLHAFREQQHRLPVDAHLHQ